MKISSIDAKVGFRKNLKPKQKKVTTQGVHLASEGLNAKRKPGDNRSSVVKRKVGRKRRGRSMGRYPFLTWAKKYLDSVGTGYAKTTNKEMERRYRLMDRELRRLFESGDISTNNPEKINAEDVLAYVNHQKGKGMKESGILHNLSPLDNLLSYAGNPAVKRFKQQYRSSVPKKRMMRYPALNDQDVLRIVQLSEQVKESEWRRLHAYALVILALSSELRNKEIRLCKVTDLDAKNWVIKVEHVKGEGTYGQARPIAIRPEAHRIMEKYLKVRIKKVLQGCPDNLALFPALKDKKDGYYSSNSIRMLKAIVEKESGLKFDLRACRRTYGQKAVDEGLTIESVSVLMGHNTTKTTETSYCRKRYDTAIREAQNLWMQGNSNPGAKYPKIEMKNEVTGYA